MIYDISYMHANKQLIVSAIGLDHSTLLSDLHSRKEELAEEQ